jgi:hypothetical protein
VRLDDTEKRRPRSLIFLPCTNVSPFTLAPVPDCIKKHRSLPDLKRGDFADPDTEVVVENEHTKVPPPEAVGSSPDVTLIEVHTGSLVSESESVPQLAPPKAHADPAMVSRLYAHHCLLLLANR